MREMILADTLEDRTAGSGQAAADAARGFRRHVPGDARPAGDHPLLDPPLHEFLPHEKKGTGKRSPHEMGRDSPEKIASSG